MSVFTDGIVTAKKIIDNPFCNRCDRLPSMVDIRSLHKGTGEWLCTPCFNAAVAAGEKTDSGWDE